MGEELVLALAIRSPFSSYVVGELSSGVGEYRQRESVCKSGVSNAKNLEEFGEIWMTLDDSGGTWRNLEEPEGIWLNLEESRGRVPVWPSAVRRKDTTRCGGA